MLNCLFFWRFGGSLFVCLSVCLFICLSVCLCLSVCFWFSMSLYMGLSNLGALKPSAIFHLRKCRKAGP